jgi:methionyl-tRNA formyltransferase
LMIETLRGMDAGTIKSRSQDNAAATLAPILTKEEGRLDFSRSAQETYNRFRGFQPWPGAFTTFRGKGLNVTRMMPASELVPLGTLLVRGNRLLAGCGNDSAVELLELQPEGKRRMPASDFVRGYRPLPGEFLDS